MNEVGAKETKVTTQKKSWLRIPPWFRTFPWHRKQTFHLEEDMDFPGSASGEEPIRDPGSIPGLGRSPGVGW